jgi:hypothetical protein
MRYVIKAFDKQRGVWEHLADNETDWGRADHQARWAVEQPRYSAATVEELSATGSVVDLLWFDPPGEKLNSTGRVFDRWSAVRREAFNRAGWYSLVGGHDTQEEVRAALVKAGISLDGVWLVRVRREAFIP